MLTVGCPSGMGASATSRLALRVVHSPRGQVWNTTRHVSQRGRARHGYWLATSAWLLSRPRLPLRAALREVARLSWLWC